MRFVFLIATLVFCFAKNAEAVSVLHNIKTQIGIFDACEETFEYSFFNDKDYNVKTTLKTSGTFGTLYPFKATYHAVGTYDKKRFYPQDYFYETDSFNHRTKEIVYDKGMPIYRISTKNGVKREAKIEPDLQYQTSNDLLSTFAELALLVKDGKKCDFEQYSFNGKKYTKLTSEYLGKEKLVTPYFKGRAMKCKIRLKILEDTDAGFLLNRDEPAYVWILNDEKTGLPFVAKIFIKSTPLGELEALTTKVEVKNAE